MLTENIIMIFVVSVQFNIKKLTGYLRVYAYMDAGSRAMHRAVAERHAIERCISTLTIRTLHFQSLLHIKKAPYSFEYRALELKPGGFLRAKRARNRLWRQPLMAQDTALAPSHRQSFRILGNCSCITLPPISI